MSSFIGSSLLGIDHIVSFQDSLVLPYRAWFELFHFMLCWFLLYGLVYIVSLKASLVHYHSYIVLFVLFHFPYWFIILFVVCVISLHSLLRMAYIVSLHASLVLPYLAWYIFFSLHASLVRHNWKWFILLHLKPHWFIITGNCIVSLHVSLVHHYWAWFTSFDYVFH
jgi:hypothetical protein